MLKFSKIKAEQLIDAQGKALVRVNHAQIVIFV